jgi:tetratricopeptide (TPR) repeat protein
MTPTADSIFDPFGNRKNMTEESTDFPQTSTPSQVGEVRVPAEIFYAVQAESLRVQNRLEEAIAVLKDGLEKTPDYLPARLLLGRCYLEKEMPAEAKIELEKVAAIIEECLPVYNFLSKVYVHERKDVDKALETVRRALYFTSQEVSKKKPAPFEMDLIPPALGEAIASPPAGPDAGEPKETALESRIKSARLAIQTDTLAEIFIKQGKPEKALAIYGKILGQDPQNEAVRQKFEALQKKIGMKTDSAAREKVIAKLEKWLDGVSAEKER